MAASIVEVSLLVISLAACHLMHLQIMWNIIFFLKKQRSASTCSLNLVDRDDVDIGCGADRVQVRQTSQVSTMLSTRSMTSFG